MRGRDDKMHFSIPPRKPIGRLVPVFLSLGGDELRPALPSDDPLLLADRELLFEKDGEPCYGFDEERATPQRVLLQEGNWQVF